MKNVLIINQSSELYGADKALLELLENFPEDFNPIVVLEHEGPLKDILKERQIQVIKCPVIKLNRATFSVSGMFRLFRHFFKGLYILRKETRQFKIDVVHSNSISILIGAFYAGLFRKKHIWHVHEIVEHPKFIARLYPRLISAFSDRIVFNSKASYEQFLKIKPEIAPVSEVIYNGQNRNESTASEVDIQSIRKEQFKADPNKTIIGLVGRISRWKGQYLLLDAFAAIHKNNPNTHLVFVGSTPPGQLHFLEKLQSQIGFLGLQNNVTVVDFQRNVWPIYDAMDICVVPSIEPEPFGLVATEAMLSKKPVIASNHGGLPEIVVHNQTGFLVEPRNQLDLTAKIEMLVNDRPLAVHMGNKGYERVLEHFSTTNYVSSFERVYREMIDGK